MVLKKVGLVIASASLAAAVALVRPPSAVPQPVQLVKVNVSVVAKGQRVSRLTGKTVLNDKNESIGRLDDIVIVSDPRSLYAVLQVGAFLGLGGRLVAVPYESLIIDERGEKIVLPGATREELNKLLEFKSPG
jgi:sporulation protein YlmC with PRC-barrel domain